MAIFRQRSTKRETKREKRNVFLLLVNSKWWRFHGVRAILRRRNEMKCETQRDFREIVRVWSDLVVAPFRTRTKLDFPSLSLSVRYYLHWLASRTPAIIFQSTSSRTILMTFENWPVVALLRDDRASPLFVPSKILA